MSENYKQLSSILGNIGSGIKEPPTRNNSDDDNESFPNTGTTTNNPTTEDDNTDLEDDDTLIHRADLDDATKRRKMTKLFCRAATTGDVDKVTQWLDEPYRAYIDIDARDQDGTTPLIYAACFGKTTIAQALLNAGAKTDVQDSYGWSALMWATNNNQEGIVKLLLENGASSNTRSAKGRTVFDFLNTDNQKIVEILATNPRDSMSSTSSIMDYEHNEFQWDRCLPDQMFVFGADNLQYILDTVITNIQLPVQSRQEICVPSNVIFLSARFAHYFSSDDLLQEVMAGAIERISKTIKANARNVHILSFWITNATQLLYYLKKDAGLVTATAEHQLRISELISEIYCMIVSDTERRLVKILPRAMLQYEQIPGMEDVNFADDWQRFFRRSTRRSVMIPTDDDSNTCNVISPQSVTSLLTSTLYVLQSYDVHPTIIIQALAQFFHYMSCELFNRILTNKKLLCRSKALQIRMNLSHVEDWITQEHLPSSLASYLEPTTHLLQLLQCLTQLPDLVSFIHTAKTFDSINALQIKRCVTNYRYEVNEPRLPDEIEKYALQIAEDTMRYKQARSLEMVRRRRSLSMSRSQMDEEDKAIEETRDTKFMLPFSVPTTAHMVSINGWAPDSVKGEERLVTPIIPDEWMEKLDNATTCTADHDSE
ncbi:hypothetical protein K492DRAFT_132656 [Lichtheimia hyalospora FSU 10163]|nr:hypothetical protein K492DRAFT_132656 [Lichtheimia hyalospora FSU 10163]